MIFKTINKAFMIAVLILSLVFSAYPSRIYAEDEQSGESKKIIKPQLDPNSAERFLRERRQQLIDEEVNRGSSERTLTWTEVNNMKWLKAITTGSALKSKNKSSSGNSSEMMSLKPNEKAMPPLVFLPEKDLPKQPGFVPAIPDVLNIPTETIEIDPETGKEITILTYPSMTPDVLKEINKIYTPIQHETPQWVEYTIIGIGGAIVALAFWEVAAGYGLFEIAAATSPQWAPAAMSVLAIFTFTNASEYEDENYACEKDDDGTISCEPKK